MKATGIMQLLTKEDYEAAMSEIKRLMSIAEDKMTDTDAKKLKMLAEAAESYEDNNLPPPAATLKFIIQVRCSQMGLKRSKAAELLGISAAKPGLLSKWVFIRCY